MAECHPVAFRWPMKAKVEHGAKLIHVDPRFTRTSAMADIHVPIRAGSDIAFLGGLITYVINSSRWNTARCMRTSGVATWSSSSARVASRRSFRGCSSWTPWMIRLAWSC